MSAKPGPKPIDGERMHEISVNMPGYYRRWFTAKAAEMNVSKAEILREALKEYVDRRTDKSESWER